MTSLFSFLFVQLLNKLKCKSFTEELDKVFNMYFLHVTYCLVCLVQFIKTDDSPLVETPLGSLRGKNITTRFGRTIFGFLGIPYAAPPVGKLRFKKPEPAMSWKGIRNATSYGNMCLQNNYLFGGLAEEISGEEDCLYLNVFTPNFSSNAYLPVMVWIHGGAYFCGSSEAFMGPEYLLDKNIVLVSMNYRLGVFGFLTTGDTILPGNYGMKDQSAALLWVRDNIKYFGGNQDSVTIFGESAGSSSVNLHMMSPLNKGLFHAAISQSGTASSFWATATEKDYTNSAKDIAAIFKCPIESSKLLKCLQKIPSQKFFKLVNNFVMRANTSMMFRPSVEPTSKDSFLPLHPSGAITSVPWMVGLTSEDGAFEVSILTRNGTDKGLYIVNKYFEILIESTLMLNQRTNSVSEVISKIRRFYFGDREININTIINLINLYTDSLFFNGINKSFQRHKGPTYYYYFDYKGTVSFSRIFGNKENDLGVCHMDDLLYLSPIKNYFPDRIMSKEELEISEKMVDLWTNFAIYRNPTPTRSVTFWEPITSSELEFLHMSKESFVMDKNLMEERRRFWLSLPIDDNLNDRKQLGSCRKDKF